MFDKIKLRLRIGKIEDYIKYGKNNIDIFKKQNSEILELLDSYLKKGELGTFKKLKKSLSEIIKLKIAELTKLNENFNSGKDVVKFIKGNSFLEPKLKELFDKEGIKINDIENKITGLNIDIPALEGAFQKIFPILLLNVEDLEKYFEANKEQLFSSEQMQNIKQYIENEQKLIQSLEDVFNRFIVVAKNAEIKKQEVSRRDFLKKMVKGAAYGVAYSAGLASIGALSLDILIVVLLYNASKLPKKDKNAIAILISEPESSLEKFGKNFVKAYIARVELAFGFRAKKVFIDATGENLRECFLDGSISNICVLGHGDRHGWLASPSRMPMYLTMEEYLPEIRKGIKKNGFLLKHTCGIKEIEDEIINPFQEDVEKLREDIEKEFETKFSSDFRLIQDLRSDYEKKVRNLALYTNESYLLFTMIVEPDKLDDSEKKKINADYRRFLSVYKKEIYAKGHFPDIIIKGKLYESIGLIRNYLYGKVSFQEISSQDIFKYINPEVVKKLQDYSNIRNKKVVIGLFGSPIFEPEKIAYWTRITWINDFLVRPFANLKNSFGQEMVIRDNFQKEIKELV